MAKKVDLKAAKAAKQKKIAIVGGLLFVALLVFQVPRTMKMLHKDAPPAAAQTASSSQQAASQTGTTTPASASGAATAVNAVLTAPLAPAARAGQLSVLSSFRSKDPFRQLIEPEDEASNASDSTASAATTSTDAKPSTELAVVPEPKPQAPDATTAPPTSASDSPPPTAPEPAPPTSTTQPAAPAAAYVSATISVNGVKENVAAKAAFPAAEPLFRLVSLTRTTATIAVAGGSLAGGSPTFTLHRGKKLKLVNTADGTKYNLLLVSTSTTSSPGSTETQPAAAAPTTPTPAEPATTTTTPTVGPTTG